MLRNCPWTWYQGEQDSRPVISINKSLYSTPCSYMNGERWEKSGKEEIDGSSCFVWVRWMRWSLGEGYDALVLMNDLWGTQTHSCSFPFPFPTMLTVWREDLFRDVRFQPQQCHHGQWDPGSCICYGQHWNPPLSVSAIPNIKRTKAMYHTVPLKIASSLFCSKWSTSSLFWTTCSASFNGS